MWFRATPAMPSSSAPPPQTESDAEVSQLKSEIDMLSLKLLRVKAQLENRLKATAGTGSEHHQSQQQQVEQEAEQRRRRRTHAMAMQGRHGIEEVAVQQQQQRELTRELEIEQRRRKRMIVAAEEEGIIIGSSSVDNNSSGSTGTGQTESAKTVFTNRSSLANTNTNTNTTAERDTIDSRLSTVLFSPSPHGSLKSPPTPQPTRLTIPVGYETQSFDSMCHSTAPRIKRNSQSMPLLEQIISQRAIRRKPTGISTASLMRQRATCSIISLREFQGSRTMPHTPRAKLIRTKSLQAPRTWSRNALPPQKPPRTFAETPEYSIKIRREKNAENSLIASSFAASSIALLSMCNHAAFVEEIRERFKQGQCWFYRSGQLFFVNPFNNLSGSRQLSYSVIPTISSSLLETKKACLLLKGVTGSGKSQLAEMVCLDIASRLDACGHKTSLIASAICALKPFLSTNTNSNNQASKAVMHYEIHVRQSQLTRIYFNHFFIDSPSRGCRANIFAMLVNEMSENDKMQYKISGFRLREKYSSFGGLEDVRDAINGLGISFNDILKILSACILINNLIFKEEKNVIDIDNLQDLEDAASLLSLSSLSLYRSLMLPTISGLNSIAECHKVRDDFVAALYSRMVHRLLDRLNYLLGNLSSCAKGCENLLISETKSESFESNSHTIHIIDVPGYVRANVNSLSELLINTTNDLIAMNNKEVTSLLLQRIELSSSRGPYASTLNRRPRIGLRHADNQFEVEYETKCLCKRNCNTLPRQLVSIFDSRCCGLSFVVKLFAGDVERMAVDDKFVPRIIEWEGGGCTVIQSVLEGVKSMMAKIKYAQIHHLICLKSNDSLEYASIRDVSVSEQLELFRILLESRHGSRMRERISVNNPSPLGDHQKTDAASRSTLSGSNVNENPLIIQPSPRSYEIRDGRKHIFPQRRTIVVDFQDPISGLSLRAGEVVRGCGFSGESYVVENGRGQRAAIPISFTEKSSIPSSNS